MAIVAMVAIMTVRLGRRRISSDPLGPGVFDVLISKPGEPRFLTPNPVRFVVPGSFEPLLDQ